MNAGKGKKAGENRDVRTCARVLQTNEFQIYRCISVSPSTKRLSYRDLSRHLFDSLSPPSRYSPRARCFLAKHSNLPCISNWNSTKVYVVRSKEEATIILYIAGIILETICTILRIMVKREVDYEIRWISKNALIRSSDLELH